MSTTKTCAKCSVVKPLEEFHRQPSGPLGRHSYCKTCFNGIKAKRPPRPTEMRRRHNLKTRYGMSPQDVEAMVASQGGLCAICEKVLDAAKMRIDHNHKTGAVRGILCNRCNLMCAALDDDHFFERAMAYVGRL